MVVKVQSHQVDLDALDRVRNRHIKWRSVYGSRLGSRYVGGEGNNPVAMLIGEAPGAQEDANLRPFVGDSGLVLRELMALAGLYTGDTPHFGNANCWLTNVIKFRPPGNKTPTDQQVVSARKLLRAEWAAIGYPPIIVTIGGVALHAVEGQKRSVLKLCGAPLYRKSETGGNLDMYVWPMIHPSFGLRGGKQVQEKLEAHWVKLGEFLNGHTL